MGHCGRTFSQKNMPENQRETRKITLPISQSEVEIITYYERGERTQLEAVIHEHGKMEMKMENGKPVPTVQLDMAGQARQRDKAIEIAVVTIDGEKATMQKINKLRNKDALFLEAEIAKIDQDTDSEELKKN